MAKGASLCPSAFKVHSLNQNSNIVKFNTCTGKMGQGQSLSFHPTD